MAFCFLILAINKIALNYGNDDGVINSNPDSLLLRAYVLAVRSIHGLDGERDGFC